MAVALIRGVMVQGIKLTEAEIEKIHDVWVKEESIAGVVKSYQSGSITREEYDQKRTVRQLMQICGTRLLARHKICPGAHEGHDKKRNVGQCMPLWIKSARSRMLHNSNFSEGVS